MKQNVKILFLIFNVFVISVHYIYPQTDQYQFEHITTSNGLSGNRIYAVIQDSRGFVWIGAEPGLNCYNGYNFIRFDKPDDPTAISNDRIKSLLEDENGAIWIGTANSGLFVYHPALDHFTSYSNDAKDTLSLNSNNIRSIYQDHHGTIWIGTKGGGLNRYNTKTDSFTAFMTDTEHPDNGKNTILSMIEDPAGTFWIGTKEGIYHFDRTDEKFTPFGIKPDIPDIYQQINCFHQDSDGNIWFGTLQGIFKYNKEENELIQINSEKDRNSDHLINDVIVSIKGSIKAGKEILWIATRNGLVKYDIHNDRFSRFVIDPTTLKSLSNNSIEDIFINNNGIMWIGTTWSGVNRLDTRGNPFYHVRVKSSDGKMVSPTAIFMDQTGYLWVGAYPGGLYKFDQQFNQIAQYSTYKGFFLDVGSTFTNWLDCIYEDYGRNLWIAIGGWGPAIFDREKESFTYIDYNLTEGYARPERIQDILQDHSGTIWFAENGLFKKEKAENLYDPVNIVDNAIFQQTGFYDIFEDSNKNLYFGTTDNGLFCLKYNDRASLEFTHYGSTVSDSPGLYKSSVLKIYEDNKGIIWVASNRGLNKFNPEKQQFDLINDTTGTFDNGVYQIFGDNKGNLWLSHWTKGLIKYHTDKRSIKFYDSNDGLPFDNLVPRYWYQSEDGRIFIPGWLGDGNGFFYFHPDSITDNRKIPKIVLTEFNVGNKPFPLDSNISAIKNISLKYNQNFFSFQFAALDYTNSTKNQYAYYLEGLENDWNYSGNRRFANYTGVPPGDYVFRVKGSNNDGYWNEAGTSINITILSPLWKTWWAYILYGLAVIIIIYSVIHYYLRRQSLLQTLAIEHIEAEKLKELDSMKSRFFANISHEFRTPLTLILGPLEKLRSKITDGDSEQNLNMMQRNALRLQKLINQLLNLSKLESGKMKLQAREENIVALVDGCVQSFESLAKQKKIDLKFKSTEKDISLFVDKDKIEKILFNLLSNAFKFTGEGEFIEVAVALPTLSSSPAGGGRGEVTIKISDTGRGIPPENLEHIFNRFYQADDAYTKDQEGTGIGLALTKELVEIHHGNITVESDFGKGSTFFVFLPQGKEHFNPNEILKETEITAEIEESQEPVLELELLENSLKSADDLCQDEFEAKNDKPFLLIVDDNTDLRTYIRGYLDTLYNISEARDGEEGFKKATEKLPDLIISDVMMPKMDGNELCEKLKTDERTSHIPVILLTARASIESKIEGLETGADDFITKPFDHQELLTRIKNLILQRNKLKEKFRKEIEFNQLSKDRTILSMDQQFIRKAKSLIEKNISEPEFSIENFAREMALSRVQLHRKLRALVGQSSTKFIRTIKLNRAAELLKNKSGTVSEIAYDVGFNTLPYFTKCFREQFGVNPSKFGN